MLDLLLSWPAVVAITAAAAVVAWYFPPFRRPALAVLGVVLSAFIIRKSGERAGEARKQEEWNNAEERMRADLRKANDRARDAVAASPPGVRSPYDRSNQ